MLIGLSALSFSYRCGLIGRDTSRLVRQPFVVEDIVALAARAGLQSIAFPLSLLPDCDPARLAQLRDLFAESGLTPVVDTDVVDAARLEQAIPVAAALGASIVRALVSPVLEGARGAFAYDWHAYLDTVIARLRAVLPVAERHAVTIAIENHQDATADDLLRILTAVGSDYLGVTFDPTNALIVADDPFAALARLGPFIRNIHLSDFIAYPSREGWRLVRCALGEGDLNIRRVLDLVRTHAPHTPIQIELVSHSARHVRLFTDAWWTGYPPRDIRDVLPVLRELAAPTRSYDDDWRTPWERGASEAQISLYEDQQFAASVAYLRRLGVLPRR